jgi:hypothetical protein
VRPPASAAWALSILVHLHKHGGCGTEPQRQSEDLQRVRDPTIPAVPLTHQSGWPAFDHLAVSTRIAHFSAIRFGTLSQLLTAELPERIGDMGRLAMRAQPEKFARTSENPLILLPTERCEMTRANC